MHCSLLLALALQNPAPAPATEPAPLVDPAPAPPLVEPVRVTAVDVALVVDGPLMSVTQRVRLQNVGAEAAPFLLAFPTGYGNELSGLTVEVDGSSLAGELLAAERAREAFRALVEDGRPVSLLEHYGQGAFLAQTDPIAAGEERELVLRYERLVGLEDGLPLISLPLSAWRRVAAPFALNVEGEIWSEAPLSSFYSPTHALQRGAESLEYDEAGVGRWRTSFRLNSAGETGDADLALVYRAPQEAELASVALLSERASADEPGTFVAVIEGVPDPDLEPEPRNVIFVVDRSGSMKDGKLTQAQSALKWMIGELRLSDRFDIVSYAAEVTTYAGGLRGPVPGEVRDAQAWVDGLVADGGTHIEAALTRALELLPADGALNQIVFLTDGLPTEGLTEERALAAAIAERNTVGARIIAFGLGFDVNAALLDRLAVENRGMAEFVLPDEDIDLAVASFYERMQAPLLVNTQVVFEGGEVEALHPAQPGELYAGSQLVVTGRYTGAGPLRVRIAGTRDGQARELVQEFPLAAADPQGTSEVIGRLWAGKRIGYLIDEIRLADEATPEAEREARIEEVVALSLRYGILTEYTSFLASDATDLYAFAENVVACTNLVEQGTAQVSGSHAWSQAANTKGMQRLACSADLGSWYDSNGALVRQSGVQCVAGRTLFRREGSWLDARLASAEVSREIELGSEEFYELCDQNAWVASCVARTGEVVLAVGEETLRFVTPAG